MTVGELIEKLRQDDPDSQVTGRVYRDGQATGDVVLEVWPPHLGWSQPYELPMNPQVRA